MTFKIVLAAALISATALTAQAKKKPDLSYGALEDAGRTSVWSIPALRYPDRYRGRQLHEDSVYVGGIAARMLERSSVDAQDGARVIAIVRDGDVRKLADYSNIKALSNDALRDLVDQNACDIEVSGPCLVLSNGTALVIGTRRVGSEVQIVKGAFTSDSRGRASLASLAQDLKDKSRAKYVIFTNDEREENSQPITEVRAGRGGRRSN